MLSTPEPDAVALRMRKHFAHKVDVEVDGSVSRIRIPAGEFELEPAAGGLAVRAEAEDEARLARVQEVAASHLARFARASGADLRWTERAQSSSLEARALAWIQPFRNARHLVRTRDWVRTLEPAAGEALVLAALLHDVERSIGAASVDDQVAAWDDRDAVRAHCERSARLVAEWLRGEGAADELADEVAELVLRHESGGMPEADVLQAADSLSFLETNPAERWVSEGRATREVAERKLRSMHDRIRLEQARPPAGRLLELGLADIERAVQE
jgi:hypothetical protein